MIHYSCDRCKRAIDTRHDLRYVVRIEIEAAMDRIDDQELVDDQDHLLEIDELLAQAGAFDQVDLCTEIYQKNRFDLCVDCHRQFIKNPMGREANVPFGFSKN